MKSLVLLFSLCIIHHARSAPSTNSTKEWESFKIRFMKKYSIPTEESLRMQVYLSHKELVARHNEKFQKGEVSFELGVNRFSDMLHSEFLRSTRCFRFDLRQKGIGIKNSFASFTLQLNDTLPDSIDWREKGAVTEVKDQGDCGSCYAFSTTGSIEGQQFRKSGTLKSLSEQQIIDCSVKYGNGGCEGGVMENAFNYVIDNGGIDSEGSYPYIDRETQCAYKPENSAANIKDFATLPVGDEEMLKLAVAKVGPISIAINTSPRSFKLYKSGVYYDKDCKSDPDDLTHAVLVVGYGTEDGKDYWLVKNSWNTDWGENGYIKMARNKNNHCGIASYATYPTV